MYKEINMKKNMSELFKKCSHILDDVMMFINTNKHDNVNDIFIKSRKMHDEQLTQLLISLDSLDNSVIDINTELLKKNMIIAIQNISSQLNNLFTKDTLILNISYNPIQRNNYLPNDRDSHYSITNIIDQGSNK